MQKLKVISIVFFLMMLLSSLSYAVKIELSDQGTSAKLNGALINGDLTVYIYTTPTGGSPIWQETFTNAIKNGSWNVMLGQNPSNPLELEFGKKYYKDYSIDGTDVDFEDNSGTLQERLEFYSPLGYINNNSLFNFSMIQSCPAGYAVRSVNEDGSVNCEQISSGAIASGWNDTGSVVELVTSTDNVNANTLYISNSLGRVGIGTSSPSSTLHVVGSATITNGLTVSGGTVSLPAGQINDAEISDLSWTKLKNYPAACNAGQAIQALNDTITCINVVESSSGITGSGTANRIAKFTDTQVIGSSGINDLSDAVAITIDSSENVGIGTTSPEKRLHIIGSGTDIPVKIEVNGGSGGKPGIELEDPTAANYGARLYFDDTLNGLQLVTLSNSVENQGIFVTRDNGNVGIGTTSPAYKLDVNGQVRIQTLNAGSTNTVVTHSSGVLQTRTIDSRVWGSSLVDYSGTSANYIPKMSDANTITNSVIYESGGNVGIGTTSPSGKLDVRGDEVRIWSGTGSVNYATGAGDLYVQDTAEVDGDLRVGGTIYGDGSGITNLPSASVQDVWVNESGDTMTGNLDMNSNDIENINVLQATKIGVTSDKATATSQIPTGYSMYVQDDIKVGGNILGYNGDVAENVFFKDDKPEPGDVVVLDSNMTVIKSYKPYDTKVAGVVSTDPAYIMAIQRDGVPLALTGIVPVKVTDENGLIKVGDLLTTSSTPGHAMKCNDLDLCKGSIIGKAMEDMNESKHTDVINMLIFPS